MNYKRNRQQDKLRIDFTFVAVVVVVVVTAVALLQRQNDRLVLEDKLDRQARQEHMMEHTMEHMIEAVHKWELVDYTQSTELIAHLADTKTTNYLDIAQANSSVVHSSEAHSWVVHSLERMRPAFVEHSLQVVENKRLQLVRCSPLVI